MSCSWEIMLELETDVLVMTRTVFNKTIRNSTSLQVIIKPFCTIKTKSVAHFLRFLLLLYNILIHYYEFYKQTEFKHIFIFDAWAWFSQFAFFLVVVYRFVQPSPRNQSTLCSFELIEFNFKFTMSRVQLKFNDFPSTRHCVLS